MPRCPRPLDLILQFFQIPISNQRGEPTQKLGEISVISIHECPSTDMHTKSTLTPQAEVTGGRQTSACLLKRQRR